MASSRKPFEERGVPGPVHGLKMGSPITFIRVGAPTLDLSVPFEQQALVFTPDKIVRATVVQVRESKSFLVNPADRKDAHKHSALQALRYATEGSHWIRGHHAEDAPELRAWEAARALHKDAL